MVDNPKVADPRLARLRELRIDMLRAYKETRAHIPAGIQARFQPLLEKAMKGEIGKEEAALLPVQMKEAYEEESRNLLPLAVGAYGGRLDEAMRMGTQQEEPGALMRAEHIFADRKYYDGGTVEEAVRVLVEKFDSIEDKNTPLSERDFIELRYIRSRHPHMVRGIIRQTLGELGHAVDEITLARMEARLERIEFDLNSENGRDTARNAVLELACEESMAAEASKPAKAARRPEPAAVKDYQTKGFTIPASFVEKVMHMDGSAEEFVRQCLGVIIHGFKLGGASPGIGRKCFPEYAVKRNVRQLKIGNVERIMGHLRNQGVLLAMGSANSINPTLKEMVQHWREMMSEVMRQHKSIIGGE